MEMFKSPALLVVTWNFNAWLSVANASNIICNHTLKHRIRIMLKNRLARKIRKLADCEKFNLTKGIGTPQPGSCHRKEIVYIKCTYI